MKPKSDAYDPKRGYLELMKVTGLSREIVKAAIRTGELPGAHVGKSYVVPKEAFDRFVRGEWTPTPRPIFSEPIKPVFIHSRNDRSA